MYPKAIELGEYKIVKSWVTLMLSARAELARRVLQILTQGQSVPTQDAVQLRNWSVHPDDALLSVEEIAHRILKEEGNPDENTAG